MRLLKLWLITDIKPGLVWFVVDLCFDIIGALFIIIDSGFVHQLLVEVQDSGFDSSTVCRRPEDSGFDSSTVSKSKILDLVLLELIHRQ